MSERNGDKARYQKNRRRTLRQRVKIREMVRKLREQAPTK
jgi:hypothetical protein